MNEVTVIIEGWASCFEKVKATKFLQGEAGYDFSQSKAAVDDILNGKDVFIHFESRGEASDFQEKIESLGANAQVID